MSMGAGCSKTKPFDRAPNHSNKINREGDRERGDGGEGPKKI